MPARLPKGLVAIAIRIVSCVVLWIAASPAMKPASPRIGFADFHGPVLRATQLHLVYWGFDWTASTPPPTSDQITAAVRTMMASSFMTGLHQYRSIGRGTLRDATTGTHPDAPIVFDDHDVRTFLDAQFSAGTVARPDVGNRDLYVVMTPFGTSSRERGYAGEHSYYVISGRRVHFAWITHRSTLADTTALISHEIVEAATDPEGSAVIGVDGTCHRPGWCEISDICSTTGVIDGVAVESYWSSADGACVLPGAPPGPPRLARVHQGNGVVHLVVDEPRIRTARRREP
ncbi:MAG: hypothetical protein ABI775_13415 [Pseudonocardiales bacterium]